MAASRHAAVKTRAFAYFQAQYEHQLARRVAETPAPSPADGQTALMRAELAFDSQAAAEACGALFLATGWPGWLTKASEFADAAGGWRPSLGWALRAVAVAPLDPQHLQRVYTVLDDAGQGELMVEIAELLVARNLHLMIAQVFAAAGALKLGNAALCLSKLKPLDDKRVAADAGAAAYLGHIRALRSTAEDKLGRYRELFAGLLALKAAERDPKIDPADFYRGTAARARLPIPPLPADPRRDVVQMVGFPRSGTTLLENALAAHPLVETFEEIPALNAAIDRIERVLVGKAAPPADPADTYVAAREKYYEEVDIRRRKAGAQVLIDKMPIRSSDAAMLAKLFPEWRYIFSIRHPYDVALSCLRQRFAPNPAMENFRSMEGVARAYDHTMDEWFRHHTMDDPQVHYVRYEQLVPEFDPVVAGVLQFLGLEWQDAVRDFAKAAEGRAAKTPSYQKVRQGVAIGVQTSWRNYGFVFQSEAAKPLRKWAEFFGYETA